jgi:hypothetical protein
MSNTNLNIQGIQIPTLGKFMKWRWSQTIELGCDYTSETNRPSFPAMRSKCWDSPALPPWFIRGCCGERCCSKRLVHLSATPPVDDWTKIGCGLPRTEIRSLKKRRNRSEGLPNSDLEVKGMEDVIYIRYGKTSKIKQLILNSNSSALNFEA